MPFDFNKAVKNKKIRNKGCEDYKKELILENGESGTSCFNDLLSYEGEGIEYVERSLEKSGIPSPDTRVCLLNDITPPYDCDSKNGETEEQFQKRYCEETEKLMIINVAEPLIGLTAKAQYHINKGYISTEEESRCPRDQMHKLFLEDESKGSEFKFIDYPDYFYYSKHVHVAIVILRGQFDEKDKIRIPVDVKNKNVILFDSQLVTTLVLNNNKNKAGTFELPRFRGIYKFDRETSSYKKTAYEIDVPLDILKQFPYKGE